MATLPDLITVAQFQQLPKGGEFAYELQDGKVVALTRLRDFQGDAAVVPSFLSSPARESTK